MSECKSPKPSGPASATALKAFITRMKRRCTSSATLRVNREIDSVSWSLTLQMRWPTIKRLPNKKPASSVNARLVTSACEESESHNCAFCFKYNESEGCPRLDRLSGSYDGSRQLIKLYCSEGGGSSRTDVDRHKDNLPRNAEL